MSINCYLAMTAAEFYCAEGLPEHTAWMACHFSCYGTGLSNFPTELPAGSLLIVDDCTPFRGHDPQQVADELSFLVEKYAVSRILLDFQRSGNQEVTDLVNVLISALSCPVGVSHCYAENLPCPVFLPPPPLHMPLKTYLAAWSGREIWLEAALGYEEITVTTDGSIIQPQLSTQFPNPPFTEEYLHCKYHICVNSDSAVFSLVREKTELKTLLQEAENLGVTLAIGLYQQVGPHT